jgi:hypothetical protein
LGGVPLRLAFLLVAVALTAGLAAGCGDASSDGGGTGPVTEVAPGKAPIGASAKTCDAYAADAEGLRATGIPCNQARQVLAGWLREPSCSLPSGSARGSCLTRSYRCQSVRGDRGLAVSCSRPGQSIAFLAKR